MTINLSLRQKLGKAFRMVCCALLAVCIFAGTLQSSAIAAPDNALDQVAGQGTSDMVEGKVKEDIGTVKRNMGKVTGQMQGAADQVKGRAQQDIGRTQNAVDEAGDNVEEATDNFVDSVKDFFGQ